MPRWPNVRVPAPADAPAITVRGEPKHQQRQLFKLTPAQLGTVAVSRLQELNLEQVRANGTAHTPGHSLLPRASGAY